MSEAGANENVVAAWRSIERISFDAVLPATREVLLEFIEEPFREAVAVFYDKNIETVWSSCNLKDYAQKQATITLNQSSLSGRNRNVAERYAHSEFTDSPPVVGLHFPIGENDLPAKIGKDALALAKQFYPQVFRWAPRWSIDEARQHFTVEGEDLINADEDNLIKLLTEAGYYFDPGRRTFYLSEEHSRKITQL